MSDAVYLYGVLASPRQPSTSAGPRGLPGASRPAALAAGSGTWLVVSRVPLALYGEAQLARGLGDLDWVSRRALAHEAVVEHFAALGPLAPAKLFTLFSSEERAVANVRRRERQLRRIFDRIRGREEWGVRVRLERAVAPRPSRRRVPPPVTGAAFLRAKRDARFAAREGAATGLRRADALFRRLSSAADESLRRPPPAGAAGARLLLDAVFLVPRRRGRAFKSEARRASAAFDRDGLSLVLTGPWPPYHFAEAR
ncbi:MAG TPA: GvpL/GvpF family gas vesicle protein [Myxococcales bacterium]|nr:GvpL/GvpF family gas vesicle protein [Myxococcales bacterium]